MKWWGSSNRGALGNVAYPFNTITPRSTLVATERVKYNCLTFKLRANKWIILNWIVRNRIFGQRVNRGLMFNWIVCELGPILVCWLGLTNHIYLIYINKPDLALNNLQWLICHKTKTNQTKQVSSFKYCYLVLFVIKCLSALSSIAHHNSLFTPS